MSLRKFFLLSIAITIFALIYVQMQVTIYDLAYQGKVREDQASRLLDRNAQATLNIAKLKSAQSLGSWFSDKNSEIDFVNQKNIVEVRTSGSDEGVRLALDSKKKQNSVNFLTQLFSLRSIAEARPVR